MTDRLSHAGFKPEMSATRGIDHGVWVPLRRMYPQADIPVVPLSVNPAGDAAHHLAVGRALSGLRAEGVLVVGSGGFVNNLGDLDWQHPEGPMPPWAAAFAGCMRESWPSMTSIPSSTGSDRRPMPGMPTPPSNT